MEELDYFRVLRVYLGSDGRMEAESKYRLTAGRMVSGALKNIWYKREVSTEAKMGMHNGAVVPSVMYGKLDMEDACEVEKEGGYFRNELSEINTRS